MPLMKEWVEIVVDEDLLVQVVRELLNVATNPNHVEVVYGTAGRVILAEVHLAEYWYQERLKVQPNDDGTEVVTEVHASGYEVVETEKVAEENHQVQSVDASPAVVAEENYQVESLSLPLPVKRGPGRPRTAPQPSASPVGEES